MNSIKSINILSILFFLFIIIKEETGFEVIRINPDKENFDILMKLAKYRLLFIVRAEN